MHVRPREKKSQNSWFRKKRDWTKDGKREREREREREGEKEREIWMCEC
jgi:hypothetical protein